MEPTSITLSYFRENLPEILAKVYLLKQRFTVTKHGKVCFIITAVDDGPDHDENAPVSPDPLTVTR